MAYTTSSPRPLGRIIADTILAYFYPITRRVRPNMRLERIYKITGGDRDRLATAYEFSSKIAARNQSAIIEYIFSLAERHKALRLAIEKRSHVDVAENELIALMNEGFFRAVFTNFELLHEHFYKRSSDSPHISIRGNWRTERRDCIITIFRDRLVDGDAPFDITQSTSINYCATTGLPFLCNDIPRAFIDSDYRSPRLLYDRAKNLMTRTTFPLRRSFLDKRWRDFWVSAEADKTFAYRSNLTVPILIEGDRLSKEALAKFDADISEKMIFGYLCFDHHKADFFDEKLDIPIAKMIADIISIFAFQRLRFTDFSGTFKQAEEIVGAHEDRDLKASLKSILESVRLSGESRKADERARGDKGIPEASIVLLNTDEMLVNLSDDMPITSEDALANEEV